MRVLLSWKQMAVFSLKSVQNQTDRQNQGGEKKGQEEKKRKGKDGLSLS